MQASKSIKIKLAGILTAVLLACAIIACGVDKSFFIGDKKIYYQVPSGYTELTRDKCERYITRMGNIMANTGVILTAYFVSNEDYALMTAPGMTDFADLAGKGDFVGDYIVVAYNESIALMDFPVGKFQKLVEEIEGFDDDIVGQVNSFSKNLLKETEGLNGVGMNITKPELVGKTADKATFYQVVQASVDGQEKGTMFLMTLQYLEGKIGIIYHYYPEGHGVSAEDFYKRHLNVLADIDLEV